MVKAHLHWRGENLAGRKRPKDILMTYRRVLGKARRCILLGNLAEKMSRPVQEAILKSTERSNVDHNDSYFRVAYCPSIMTHNGTMTRPQPLVCS